MTAAVSLEYDTITLAQDYEQISAEHQYKEGQLLLRELGVTTGERVLDVGAGTGLLAAYAADLVGLRGSVIGIDPLSLRIEVARQKARANLGFEVGNACDLTKFPAGSFHVVYLNAVFHWLQEKRGPLRQIARVLKPGGRIGITTGSKQHPNPQHAIKAAVLSREPYARYPKGQLGRLDRLDVTELDQLLDEAGFVNRSVEIRTTLVQHASAEAAIRFSEASSFGNFLGHLPEPLRLSARREIEEELEKQRTADGIRHEGGRIFAIAFKP